MVVVGLGSELADERGRPEALSTGIVVTEGDAVLLSTVAEAAALFFGLRGGRLACKTLSCDASSFFRRAISEMRTAGSSFFLRMS